MSARWSVLGVDNAGFAYQKGFVFRHVSFLLDDSRTALVGENGAGKSTLLKCLSGELELDEGHIVRSRSTKVGYVPQEIPPAYFKLTVREVMEQALVRGGAEGEDWRIDIMLEEIGMDGAVAAGDYAALSGGWQRLVLVACAAILEDPDILVLDEPTNHLDLGNIATLERWLTEVIKLPMLIVSHDREFLNRVTSRTIFLRADGAHAFRTGFSHARQTLLERDAVDARHRALEEKEIRRLEETASRYKVWAQKNDEFDKKRKIIERKIERLEGAKTKVYVARERRLELGEAEMEAKVALRVEGLAVKTPDGRPLFSVERLAVRAGDRIALLGVNGAGKSTVLSVLAKAFAAKDAHYDGKAPVRFNPGARLAVFDQAMADLPLDDSLVEYMCEVDGIGQKEAIQGLIKAGFPFKRLDGAIGLLSFGERARLKFLRLKSERPNFYLLDEPTNHLDIEGQEALEGQLTETDVACLFVSHDRYFTRAAATRFLEIRRGKLIEVDDPDAFFEAQV
ncbi:MAG TPA: ABC-F family ATP-binding cassette domain-containing protein [Caulobacteraceae bacterium]|nr:ABC-F family ATP-binding cassette domain-containing protein [Caulobacteraceae bacterium]